jgi:hypothetical protein
LREEEERKAENERRRLKEKELEELRIKEEQHLKEERERQKKLKAEYEAKETETISAPADELDKVKDIAEEEEKKGLEEKYEAIVESPETVVSVDLAKQFLITLLNPDTPASKKKELLMA